MEANCWIRSDAVEKPSQKKGELIASGGGLVKRLKDNATFSLSQEQRRHLEKEIRSFRGVIDTSVLEE